MNPYSFERQRADGSSNSTDVLASFAKWLKEAEPDDTFYAAQLDWVECAVIDGALTPKGDKVVHKHDDVVVLSKKEWEGTPLKLQVKELEKEVRKLKKKVASFEDPE